MTLNSDWTFHSKRKANYGRIKICNGPKYEIFGDFFSLNLGSNKVLTFTKAHKIICNYLNVLSNTWMKGVNVNASDAKVYMK